MSESVCEEDSHMGKWLCVGISVPLYKEAVLEGKLQRWEAMTKATECRGGYV